MAGKMRAQQIAARYASDDDADWNKIALFIRDGVVEDGLGLALREVRDYAINKSGGKATAEELHDLDEAIQYVVKAERAKTSPD